MLPRHVEPIRMMCMRSVPSEPITTMSLENRKRQRLIELGISSVQPRHTIELLKWIQNVPSLLRDSPLRLRRTTCRHEGRVRMVLLNRKDP